ncbi:methylmalonyl Co-A mutase-associated GTPase MeaB [Paenalkalicoccus suaedae]|uniref:Methylmalonyl Co-A mutase-associated GTPase MeaB n=1 Tax=Paenalkalicoccus suaedae TaxID=2592382 RepID=A0A859FI62_9BACI|nr:methylmalonyl Co-A mutase-associated GTPase MeaB [Paenalkalicoccus suaedae]QKS72791.1 methylmalonyl Co-A mutase-associated GTPase MeaB [Paenalkalicoccus suaedae]
MDIQIEKLLQGDHRTLAKAISAVENRSDDHRRIMKDAYPHTGGAQVIGITGSPGAGKSSLVTELVKEWRSAGDTVAIVAVDPTSPFSGGALLGDRIRMHAHDGDPGVFIRSMGTRGSLGGLSEACQDTVRLMEAAGFDRIIIETVGVGQSELDVMKTADTIVLVLYPSGGDIIQAFKAGIMEIADLFVINKADLPGVPQLRGELEDLVHMTKADATWEPPIVETVATSGSGRQDVVKQIKKHHEYLKSSGEKHVRRAAQRETEVMRRLLQRVELDVQQEIHRALEDNSEADPYDVAEMVYDRFRRQEE